MLIHNPPQRIDWLHVAGVPALLMLFTLVGLVMLMSTQPFSFGDAERYLAMAQSPWVFTDAPWGYRIGVPYLAAWLSPLFNGIHSAFFALQLLFYASFLTALYLWLRWGLKLNILACACACLLFIFSYPGVYNLHNSVHVGLAEHLGILLGCIAIYHRSFRSLLLLLVITAFVKENIGLLLIPTWAWVTYRSEGWRSALLTTLPLLAVFFSLYLLLRSGMLFQGGIDLSTYTGFYNAAWLAYVYQYWGGVLGAIKMVVATFGPLWLTYALAMWQNPGQQRLRWMGILPLLACGQILLATDVWRMVGLGAPMVIALSAVVMDRLPRHSCVVLVCLNTLYFLAFNNTLKTLMAALFALAFVALWFYRQRLNFSLNQPQLDPQLDKFS
ncbi:hypothetical protein KUV56_07080 [Ferrimonas balearica]|uniref:hypothetical protein n=1 Tax=Ferrimonas balearica TaxID=44012 RepID=UPI001C56E676|nr:hypothetical protein [Ferrimonas balearica]MBW3139296.1 hypothetical protein [Ferrimonas balearica]MBY6106360.1 hypothetical protein [Ferrimonas balearica]